MDTSGFLVILGSLFTGFTLGGLIMRLWDRAQGSPDERIKIELATLRQEREINTEKIQWIEQAEKNMCAAFEALASRALHTNSEELLNRAGQQMETVLGRVQEDWKTRKVELQNLVDPLRQNLSALDGHVRDLEQKREGAYHSLQEQLRQLARAHSELQTTTVTLTQALKSPTVRGRWGELQLRRVVEMAGMVNHVAFQEQVSTDGGRPDMIVHLPHDGILPVDSKVPLEAYLNAMEASDEPTRKTLLERHSRAMLDRVRELSQKKYWEQFERAPDFVVMFIPNEACLGAAFESRPRLLESAIEQRILLTTPVTLLALLRSVAYGWQQQQITENAHHIAAQGRELYKRLQIFVNHLGELRKGLNRTVEGYNKVVGSLDQRLMPVARRFQEAGITTEDLSLPETIDTHPRIPTLLEGETVEDENTSSKELS